MRARAPKAPPKINVTSTSGSLYALVTALVVEPDVATAEDK